MRIRELRAEARNALKGNLMKVALPIVYSLIIPYVFIMIGTFASSCLAEVSKILMFAAMCVFVIVGIFLGIWLSYGVMITAIKISRNEEPHYFKDSFSKQNRKLAVSAVNALLTKTILWFLLSLFGGLIPLIGPFIAIGSIIMLVKEIYNCFFINYLLYDYPDKPVKELLEKSKMMMNGNRAKAMVIPMTLMGWNLLNFAVIFGISLILNIIWPPYMIYFETISTVPLWATILEYIVSLFLSSMLTAYLNMINYQLYMEQKPLEIYNDDYLKPETNQKKYIWIASVVIATPIVLIAGYIIFSIMMIAATIS